MSDKAKLNAEQTRVESALRDLDLQDSGIDHGSIMYQAGWAAAMAECNTNQLASQNQANSGNRKLASRIWPALAVSFAATTAACLFVILSPQDANTKQSGTTMAGTASQSPSGEIAALDPEPMADLSTENRLDDVNPQRIKRSSSGLRIPPLFGTALRNLVEKHNAQLQGELAKTTTKYVPTFSDIDWAIEPSTPLTPRSINTLSL